MEYLLGFMVDFLPSHVWFWGFHGWFNSFALREHVFSQISHHLILGWCLDAETRIKFEAFTGFMWKQMGLFLVFPDWFGVLENRSETLLQFAFRCLWTAERPGSLFLFFPFVRQTLIFEHYGIIMSLIVIISHWYFSLLGSHWSYWYLNIDHDPSVWPALSGRWKWTAERSVHFRHSRCHVVKIRHALQIFYKQERYMLSAISWSKLI